MPRVPSGLATGSDAKYRTVTATSWYNSGTSTVSNRSSSTMTSLRPGLQPIAFKSSPPGLIAPVSHASGRPSRSSSK